MKRLFIAIGLALALALASACDERLGCTQCGFEPNQHILTSYVDSAGATIQVSGYAGPDGCFRPYGCE